MVLDSSSSLTRMQNTCVLVKQKVGERESFNEESESSRLGLMDRDFQMFQRKEYARVFRHCKKMC